MRYFCLLKPIYTTLLLIIFNFVNHEAPNFWVVIHSFLNITLNQPPTAAFPILLYCTQLICDYNPSQNLCFLQCLVKYIIVNVNNYASLLLLKFRNCVPSNVSYETFNLKYSSPVFPAYNTTFSTVCCCLCISVLTILCFQHNIN